MGKPRLYCEVVIPFSQKNREAIFQQINEALILRYDDYQIHALLDGDTSDIV